MESNRGDERCGRHTQRAHHMRRGRQPGMHRTPHTTHDTHSNPRQQTHTHTQPCRNTNTQMEEVEANRSGTQGSTACTYGESGPSCRHPSRRVRTHTRGGAAHTATQKQSNNNKKRDPLTPHGLLVHGKCSQYSSHEQFSWLLASVHIQRTPLHASTVTTTATAAHANISARNGIMQPIIYLCFCLSVGRSPHILLLFFRRVNFHAWSCVEDFCRVHNYFFLL
ncbi:hypothetical protein ECC02_012739 [Trypanosoma cruzi]|uniref:Uncharacterized protein n=1 Tax=Trypanosoma cruzi TaxID=5693 RepID=A0A7J6XJP7_TRYCR|nr:hypothetical protein ECC02_012739 [Trypanosoma cruzi]